MPEMREALRGLRARFSDLSGRVGPTLFRWVGGVRGLRGLSVLIVPLVLSPWLGAQIDKYVGSPLFRDAAMCQYTGWCIRHGVRMYGAVGAPDGPFIHFLHALIQVFGGVSDAGCRKVDLALQILMSGAMGVALAPRFAENRVAAVLQRLAWGCFAATLWLSWYIPEGWGQTVQRDPYYALFGYTGLILLHASADQPQRRARILAFAGGLLTTLMVFTRQPGIAYPACAALGLLVADDPVREKLALRRRAALLGGASCLLGMFLLLLIFGSLPGYWFWYTRYPLEYYRFFSAKPPFHLFTEAFTGGGSIAVIALVGVVMGVAVRALPRRALALAFPPMLLLIAACIAGKGWPNHEQQTRLSITPLALLVAYHLWDYRGDRERWLPVQSLVAAAFVLFMTSHTYDRLMESSYHGMPQPQEVDRDITDAKTVGRFIKQYTKPDETVLHYGHEAHVLLEAERKPAMPYYCNLIFNVYGFYKSQPADAKVAPDEKQLAKMKRLQDDMAADACKRLMKTPPGAMVFLDGSLNIVGDSVADVVSLCPPLKQQMADHYNEVKVPNITDRYRVFLKRGRPGAP
jgi:hypothetical protein